MKRFTSLSDYEKEVYERVEFTFLQKLKFHFSNTFRGNIKGLISDYDFQLKIYEENKESFEEIEESASLILGGVSLEQSLNKIRKEEQNNRITKRKTMQLYQVLLDSLKDINKFNNEWNMERHEQYKKCNCKRLLLELKSRFDEGAKYIVLLKVSAKTDFSKVERQLERLPIKENKYIISEDKILDCDYFIGLELDGVVIKKGCTYMEMYEIIWDAFSFLPFFKLLIKSY